MGAQAGRLALARLQRLAFRVLLMLSGLGACGLLLGTGCQSRSPSKPGVPERMALQGWRIGFDEPSLAQPMAGFAGEYRSGEVFFVPASSSFTLESLPAGLRGSFTAEAGLAGWEGAQGRVEPLPERPGAWACRAPVQAGLYQLCWSAERSGAGEARSLLPILVLEEAQTRTKEGRTRLEVNGKHLGSYSDPARSTIQQVREHAARYQPPLFFATLTEGTLGLSLSEGLELGQLVAFIDRREPNGRKVITDQRHTEVLPPSRALCLKLARLRERLVAEGVPVTRFWITSGFRTPDFNKSIGGAVFSRHCYGDAVDLCIDRDGDRHMDDLNGDGKLDRQDGLVIARACLALESEGLVVPGGIGVYEWDGEDSVRSHVHIDCRGYPMRWGQATRGRQKSGFDWWSRPGTVSAEASTSAAGE